MYSALALIGDTFQARIGIWKCWFLRRGENGIPGEKPLTQPPYDAGPGIEPGTHCWEAILSKIKALAFATDCWPFIEMCLLHVS